MATVNISSLIAGVVAGATGPTGPTGATGASGATTTISNGTSNLNIATSGGAIYANTAGTNAITVDASQNVGIGTASPTQKLTVAGSSSLGTASTSGNTAIFQSPGSLYLTLNTNGTLSGNRRNWAISPEYDVAGALSIACGASEGAVPSSPRLIIKQQGTVILSGGSTSADGTGITFPATQSASSDANTLDDYEEGTWTPSLNFAGGTTGMTYASFGQVGTYVKVGKNVTVTVWLQLATKGSSTGIAYINNLPFTSQANTNGYAGAAIAHWGGISTVTWVALYLTPSSTQLIFSGGIPPSGTNSALTNSNITDGTYILNTFTYIAAA